MGDRSRTQNSQTDCRRYRSRRRQSILPAIERSRHLRARAGAGKRSGLPPSRAGAGPRGTASAATAAGVPSGSAAPRVSNRALARSQLSRSPASPGGFAASGRPRRASPAAASRMRVRLFGLAELVSKAPDRDCRRPGRPAPGSVPAPDPRAPGFSMVITPAITRCGRACAARRVRCRCGALGRRAIPRRVPAACIRQNRVHQSPPRNWIDSRPSTRHGGRTAQWRRPSWPSRSAMAAGTSAPSTDVLQGLVQPDVRRPDAGRSAGSG